MLEFLELLSLPKKKISRGQGILEGQSHSLTPGFLYISQFHRFKKVLQFCSGGMEFHGHENLQVLV